MSGGVGIPRGLAEGGFGDVGEANMCSQRMARAMKRLGDIRDNVEGDSINMEKYLKELAVVSMDLTKACGRMFEQQHLRFTLMFAATKTT